MSGRQTSRHWVFQCLECRAGPPIFRRFTNIKLSLSLDDYECRNTRVPSVLSFFFFFFVSPCSVYVFCSMFLRLCSFFQCTGYSVIYDVRRFTLLGYLWSTVYNDFKQLIKNNRLFNVISLSNETLPLPLLLIFHVGLEHNERLAQYGQIGSCAVKNPINQSLTPRKIITRIYYILYHFISDKIYLYSDISLVTVWFFNINFVYFLNSQRSYCRQGTQVWEKEGRSSYVIYSISACLSLELMLLI